MSLLDDHLPAPARAEGAPSASAAGGHGWANPRSWPPSLLVGVIVFGVVLAVLILTPWITPHDPTATESGQSLKPGFWAGNVTHFLGTDLQGRDIKGKAVFVYSIPTPGGRDPSAIIGHRDRHRTSSSPAGDRASLG